jgi:hypothetical protein
MRATWLIEAANWALFLSKFYSRACALMGCAHSDHDLLYYLQLNLDTQFLKLNRRVPPGRTRC